MVVSVRAAGVVCLGMLALTAAAPAPGDAPTPAALLSASAQAPAYFVLTDRGDDAAPMPDTAEDATDESTTDETLLVRRDTAQLSAEERCVAAAVYYESRGEPLAGQMAVAHVILNRVRSGRFADTPCGVVRQPGQFSFVHRTFSPPVNADWKKAVAVARVAMAGGAGGGIKRALYFHASYVAPGWNRSEVTTIGRHVFYR